MQKDGHPLSKQREERYEDDVCGEARGAPSPVGLDQQPEASRKAVARVDFIPKYKFRGI